MHATYTETHNKTQLVSAILAVPYMPGETARIVAKHSRGETRYTLAPRKDEDSYSFDQRLRRIARNVKRSPADLWR